MTYCVGLKIDRGIVFASDTRTNAGLDNVACFKKMYVWDEISDRTFVLLTSGNLAVSQAVVTLLSEQISDADHDGPFARHCAHHVPGGAPYRRGPQKNPRDQ